MTSKVRGRMRKIRRKNVKHNACFWVTRKPETSVASSSPNSLLVLFIDKQDDNLGISINVFLGDTFVDVSKLLPSHVNGILLRRHVNCIA